jgi:hypothetical protein
VPDVSKMDFIVSATDMDHETVQRMANIIKTAFVNDDTLKEVSEGIKKNCDCEFGPFWHCVVGYDYSSAISYGIGRIVYIINLCRGY